MGIQLLYLLAVFGLRALRYVDHVQDIVNEEEYRAGVSKLSL